MQKLTDSTEVFELKLLLLLDVVDADVAKPAIQVVQLKQQEVRFVLADVVVWSQVNGHVDLTLDYAH